MRTKYFSIVTLLSICLIAASCGLVRLPGSGPENESETRSRSDPNEEQKSDRRFQIPKIRRAGLPPPYVKPAATEWWVDLIFDPEIDGIDAPQVAAENGWSKAIFLETDDLLERIPTSDLVDFEDSDFGFSKNAELDGDGVQETFQVGVYRTGEPGTTQGGVFLYVFERGSIFRQVLSRPGPLAFSALIEARNGLLWSHCLECNDFETVVWTGKEFVLQ